MIAIDKDADKNKYPGIEQLDTIATPDLKFYISGLKQGTNKEMPVDASTVKQFFQNEYGIDFKAEKIEVKDKAIKIDNPFEKPEDWDTVKAKGGNPALPYKLTVVVDGTQKAFKIAFYRNGTHAIEEVK